MHATEDRPAATRRQVFELLAREHQRAQTAHNAAVLHSNQLWRYLPHPDEDSPEDALARGDAQDQKRAAKSTLDAARAAIHAWLAREGVTIAEMTANPNTEPMPSLSQEQHDADAAHALAEACADDDYIEAAGWRAVYIVTAPRAEAA